MNVYISIEKSDRIAVNFKIQQPKINSELAAETFQARDEAYYHRCVIQDCFIVAEDVEGIVFEEVIFKNVVFEDVAFHKIELMDVIFDHCDLSNADFSLGSIHRAVFKDSKMLGINLTEASLGNVLFEGCHANLSSFGFAKLKQVKFAACTLNNADFYDCEFQKVGFEQCELSEASFVNTTLKGIDLSTCTFSQLQVSLDNLTGCVITADQAVGFAQLLGLEIKE